jgi:hypothetical protein
MRRLLIGTFATLVALHGHATAQTAQRWSVQLSALGVELTSFDQDNQLRFGGGVELQARFNPSALSIGFGLQTTRHKLENTVLQVARSVNVTYTGAFLEPRLILGSLGDLLAFYGSARFMLLNARFEVGGTETKVDGAAISGGGGLLIRLGSRMNAELGATAGKEYYNRNTEEGTTIVTRVGIAIGLG